MSEMAAPALRGIILRGEDDKVIVQARPQDVQRFAPRGGEQVYVRPADIRLRVGRWGGMMMLSTGVMTQPITFASSAPMMGETAPELDPADYLYDRHGRPVAVINDIQVHVDQIDVTTFGGTRQFINGQQMISISAQGLPGVRVLG